MFCLASKSKRKNKNYHKRINIYYKISEMVFTEYIESMEESVDEINKYMEFLTNKRRQFMSKGSYQPDVEDDEIISKINKIKGRVTLRIELVELLITFSEKYAKYKNKLDDDEKQKLTRMSYMMTSALAGRSNFNDFISHIYETRNILDDIKKDIPSDDKINGSDIMILSSVNMIASMLMGHIGGGKKARYNSDTQNKLLMGSKPTITEIIDDSD